MITDVSNRLSETFASKSCLWIQAYHSFCYKRYNFHDSLSCFDLLLLPGTYHYDAYLRRMKSSIREEQLAITGFPKMDLLSSTCSSAETFRKYSLNPSKQTILYAPTWGGTTQDGTLWSSYLWPRWDESDQLIYLEEFLKHFSSDYNIVIKPHHFCPSFITDRAPSLCNDYGSRWITSNPSSFSDPFELLAVSDLLISDVSGIIPEFLFLGKPVVFIEPDVPDIWSESSLPESYRCGPVITEFSVLDQTSSALSSPEGFYRSDRESVTRSLFRYMDFHSADRAYKAITDLYLSTH